MKAVIYPLLILIQFSQIYAVCDTGYFQAKNTFRNGTKCYQCPPQSNGCSYDQTTGIILWDAFATEVSGCTINSNVVTGGVTYNSFTCFCQQMAPSGTYPSFYSVKAYNPTNLKCENCAEGCLTCFIDVSKCTSCKGGYQLHRDSFSCVRVQLGLGAINLALSILILLFSIIGCCKARRS